MMVFISNGKTTCFGLWRPSSGFDSFLLKEFYIILYKTLLARKLSKPEDDHYRPKHAVFPLLINTII